MIWIGFLLGAIVGGALGAGLTYIVMDFQQGQTLIENSEV